MSGESLFTKLRYPPMETTATGNINDLREATKIAWEWVDRYQNKCAEALKLRDRIKQLEAERDDLRETVERCLDRRIEKYGIKN